MVNVTRTLEYRPRDSVVYNKPVNNRIPLRSRGRLEETRSAHSVHTQTPLTELSYEFDRALYTFKEKVRRTMPANHNNSQRHHSRIYLPTIIDTKPRSRKLRAKSDTVLTRMLSCTHRAPPHHSLAPCTCNHRPPTRTDKRQEDKPCKAKHTPRDQARDRATSAREYDTMQHTTPVLAVAIRRNAQDKDPIVQFNGIVGHASRISFTPFVRHVSTQTSKSNVHVEFELPDEN